MIDLHCHILPGVDDGPAEMGQSLELAREAAGAGTTTIAATSHVREDYPFPLESIGERVAEVNQALERERIALHVVRGGELAVTKAGELSDAEVAGICLGDGPYVLVETPYTHAGEMVETTLFDLQVRGFRPVLAHPERSPTFQGDLQFLGRLVERGVLSSVTAGSIEGRFGRTVKRFTLELMDAGLVHNVASDSHGDGARSPDLGRPFETLAGERPDIAEHGRWYTEEVPGAILAGEDVGPPPSFQRQGGWRRLFGRG